MIDPELSRLFNAYRDQVANYLQSLEILPAFPDCQRLIVHHTQNLHPLQTALPVISCLAAGGSLDDGIRLSAAWFPMYLASELLDDVEDQEFIPDEFLPSPEVSTNIATSLVFLSFHILTLIQSPGGAVRASQFFSSLGIDATYGQHRDLTVSSSTVEQALNDYLETTILKAGSVARMATAGGAAAGTSDGNIISALGDYGTALGVILQVLDDCRDAFSPLEEGLQEWEVSLPLLMYLMITGQETIVYPEVKTRSEWSSLLRETGVIQALSNILLEWRDRASKSIQAINTPEKALLEKIASFVLESVAAPEA